MSRFIAVSKYRFINLDNVSEFVFKEDEDGEVSGVEIRWNLSTTSEHGADRLFSDNFTDEEVQVLYNYMNGTKYNPDEEERDKVPF